MLRVFGSYENSLWMLFRYDLPDAELGAEFLQTLEVERSFPFLCATPELRTLLRAGAEFVILVIVNGSHLSQPIVTTEADCR